MVRADRAVITVPIGVLKTGTIDFDPGLPNAEQEAIKALGAGLLDKLWLAFPKPFWDKDVDVIEWLDPDKPGLWSWWVNGYKAFGKPVLLGFNGGDHARELAEAPDDEIVVTKPGNASLRHEPVVYGDADRHRFGGFCTSSLVSMMPRPETTWHKTLMTCSRLSPADSRTTSTSSVGAIQPIGRRMKVVLSLLGPPPRVRDHPRHPRGWPTARTWWASSSPAGEWSSPPAASPAQAAGSTASGKCSSSRRGGAGPARARTFLTDQA